MPECVAGQSSMGQPAAPSSFSRHLFPLPHREEPKILSQPCSRKGQQRLLRQVRKVRDLNSVIDCLNWMANKQSASHAQSDSMTEEVIVRLEGLVASQQPNRKLPSPKAALQQLLRSRDYTGVGSASVLAPYRPGLVSLPEGDFQKCPFLFDLLDENDRQYLSGASERFVRPVVGDSVIVEPYWDPKLKYSQKSYHKLVQRLHAQNYFYFTLDPLNFVGIFFVWKSSNTKLRMISDARLSNAGFYDPPPVQLLTGEGLGAIEIEYDGECCVDVAFIQCKLMSGRFLGRFVKATHGPIILRNRRTRT